MLLLVILGAQKPLENIFFNFPAIFRNSLKIPNIPEQTEALLTTRIHNYNNDREIMLEQFVFFCTFMFLAQHKHEKA